MVKLIVHLDHCPKAEQNVPTRASIAYLRENPAMTRDLEALVEKARRIEMTPDQQREQRQSFVYGNTHIENDRITRQMVAEVDASILKAMR